MEFKQKAKNSRDHRAGQGVVEYILMVAAVIAVLLVFFARDGIFQKAYNRVIDSQGNHMMNMAVTIFN